MLPKSRSTSNAKYFPKVMIKAETPDIDAPTVYRDMYLDGSGLDC